MSYKPLITQDEKKLIGKFHEATQYLCSSLPRSLNPSHFLNILTVLSSARTSSPKIVSRKPSSTFAKSPNTSTPHQSTKNAWNNPVHKFNPNPNSRNNPNIASQTRNSKVSNSPIPHSLLLPILKYFNNQYSIALMEKDIANLATGPSKYAKAISKVLPKTQVNPIMSTKTTDLLSEASNLVLALSKKQLEVNLSLYQDYRTGLLSKISGVTFPQDHNMTPSVLAKYLTPLIEKNIKSRRAFGELKSTIRAQVQKFTDELLHSTNINMEVQNITTVALPLFSPPPIVVTSGQTQSRPNKRPRQQVTSSSSSGSPTPIATPMESRPSSPLFHTRKVKQVRTTLTASTSVVTSPMTSSFPTPSSTRPQTPVQTGSLADQCTSSINIDVGLTEPQITFTSVKPSKDTAMTIAPVSEAIMDMTTLSILDKLPENIAPIPESPFIHFFDKTLTKEKLLETAKNSLTTYSASSTVIVQLVMDIERTPPPSHFSFSSTPTFMHSNLPWLKSLGRPFILEIFTSSITGLSRIGWDSLLNWSNSCNVQLLFTVPKSLVKDTESALKNVCKKSPVVMDRHFL